MKSVLVIGMGRLGRHLALKMQELGNDVLVADSDAALIEQISGVFEDAQICDCTNEAVIRALGVNNFDICFVTIGEDFEASLVITALLKKYGAKFVVAKSNQEIQRELLIKIGADEIINPEKEFAEKLAIRYNAKNIFDCIQLTSEYSIYEIPILKEWIGHTVSEVNVRRTHKINIIAIKNENVLRPLPGADYIFGMGDHMVVIGKSTDVFKLTSKT